jgi:hypothetical protein
MPKKDLNSLCSAVRDMDCFAQQALGEIVSLARLSLAWLETPEGQSNTETIAAALNSIWFRAQNAAECIGLEADGVDCAFIDEAQVKRCRASDQVSKGGVNHA